ncbi:MAG: DUF1566 domain-containing protein [Candidatus Electrothrix sp. AW2]|nr:DUF1566 domain-containing protein [Candidatus Electrothrix sp. AX1]MCI5134791.1 DUF1566 domain-containing protein [Candidatus Electrothrix gigas]
MRTFFLMLCCMASAATVHAACNSNIPASTPDSQLIDNGDGTVTDTKTDLMWKQCLEGLSGDCFGTADTFTWQQALQQPGKINDTGGFAGYTDWRLPNIQELNSLVEEQCYSPAINLTYFPNTPSGAVWSGSPFAGNSDSAWGVHFDLGCSGNDDYSSEVNRLNEYAVRLVRNAQ